MQTLHSRPAGRHQVLSVVTREWVREQGFLARLLFHSSESVAVRRTRRPTQSKKPTLQLHHGPPKKRCQSGGRRRIRTSDPLLVRQVLYTAELCAHERVSNTSSSGSQGVQNGSDARRATSGFRGVRCVRRRKTRGAERRR